jgi:hypothetical protein
LLIVCNYSCSEKFKVGAPYKDVTVVLGLLNANDTAHYVKITRGFFDEAKNNIDLAKFPDSIYYNNLDVKIDVKNGSGGIVKSIVLNKVKLSDEGITKDTGVFVNNPAYAYKFKEPLNASYTYNLSVKLPNGKEVKGVTPVLGDINVSTFPGVLNFADPSAGVNFKWIAPLNAGVCEFYYRFKYVEENTQTMSSESKFVDLPIIPNQVLEIGKVDGAYAFKNQEFYSLLSANIPTKGLQYVRYVDTGDVICYSGSRELSNYINQNKAQGGLTADQIKPIFSNLTGEDVYGLFSTRSKQVRPKLFFTQSTVDSMKTNPTIAKLQFLGWKK